MTSSLFVITLAAYEHATTKFIEFFGSHQRVIINSEGIPITNPEGVEYSGQYLILRKFAA